MEGRRIIFIGDSMSWQMFVSLACLLAPVTDYSSGGTWDKANTTVTGGYSGREWPDSRHISLQYFAQVSLPARVDIWQHVVPPLSHQSCTRSSLCAAYVPGFGKHCYAASSLGTFRASIHRSACSCLLRGGSQEDNRRCMCPMPDSFAP